MFAFDFIVLFWTQYRDIFPDFIVLFSFVLVIKFIIKLFRRVLFSV